MINLSVIYYSSTGNIHSLAKAASVLGEKAGAEVRLRKVAELAPAEAIAANPAWAEHAAATTDVTEASLADLEWSDAVLFGTPTRFGLPAAQLKQFLDSAGGLWFEGKLVNKVVGSFTSSSTTHGGQEATILALHNTFYHWGSIIVPNGLADQVQFSPNNGNPYGTSSISSNEPNNVHDDNYDAIEYQVRRTVDIATALRKGFAAS